jgi:2-polyprenyl-6-methoxyphenol hydroxylase-like FAD-dependent oxidoreductase
MPERNGEHDVAIVGAGAAGASLALLLARRGVRTALIDPRPPRENDFRAEKLTPAQWDMVKSLGLEPVLRPVVTFEPEVWVARRGRVVEKRASGNFNFRYPDFIGALRDAVESEPRIEFLRERAADIAASDDLQQIVLGGGRRVAARLVVVATGGGAGLGQNLGFRQKLIFARHSVSVGFDMAPAGWRRFDFPAITYYSDNSSYLAAFLSIFPIGAAMRGNLFVYRAADDPWFQRMASAPERALREIMPGLTRLTGDFTIAGAPAFRPVDLYRMENVDRPGVVLIGDSFGTACPASGSGLDKVFSDVLRVAAHLPAWLAAPGMGAEKIAQFYADPEKCAADASSLSRSRGMRDMSIAPGLSWRLRRDAGFLAQSARGKLRAALDFRKAPALASPPA